MSTTTLRSHHRPHPSGKIFGSEGKRKTSEAIKKLIGLQPRQPGHSKWRIGYSVKKLHRDIVVARPGEKIPVDGIVKEVTPPWMNPW